MRGYSVVLDTLKEKERSVAMICVVFFDLFIGLVLNECDRKIRLRMEEEKKKGDARWEVLVRKVASAKAMSFLALPKRKRVEEIRGEGQ